MSDNPLRSLPSVDELLRTQPLQGLLETHDRSLVVDTAREALESARKAIRSNTAEAAEVSSEHLAAEVKRLVSAKLEFVDMRAVNATGVILHTGLGRAMLAERAVESVANAISGYSMLAVDVETGQRGSRDVYLSDLLCELTGAEAATIVNNNAAATMLILNTLAAGKEVIVSRGQLVEIGGSFRMPDVMEMSGAKLREVGTTNKTHLRDYVSAINENTGAILKVHQSNYKIVGFTQEPGIEELARLGRERGIPVIDDLGSGALIDMTKYGLEPEPMVVDSVNAGADVVCFSGDKLIGGPQSGIIVGRKETIARIKKNPLARALRVGKMTVAAMQATLRLFLDPSNLEKTHPTYRMLAAPLDELRTRAEVVANALTKAEVGAVLDIVSSESQVGSGSAPGQTMPSVALSVKPSGCSADDLARTLRKRKPAIVARIHQDRVLFDFRTIQAREDALVASTLIELLGGGR